MAKRANDKKTPDMSVDYRRLLSAMNEAIMVTDKNGKISFANPSLCRLMEFDADEILEKNIDDFLDEKNRDLNRRKRKKRMEGKPTNFEISFNRKNGSQILCEVSVAPLLDDDGKFAGSIGTVKDITRIRQEQELLRLYKSSIEQAPEGIFWMRRDGGFSYVNEQACKTLGYTREELMNIDLWDIAPSYPKSKYDEGWNASKEEGQVNSIQIESTHIRKDGVAIPVEVFSKHIMISNQDFHVAFVRDISGRKQVEHLLKINQFALDNASISCFLTKSDGRIVYVNNHASKTLGYSIEELRSKNAADIDTRFSEQKWSDFWASLARKKTLNFESYQQRKDGSSFPVEVSVNYVEFDGQEYAYAFTRDLTERNRARQEREQLEQQLMQSQKLESVGRLAGGVAHDFNNMLSVILGYSEMMQSEIADNPFLTEGMNEIERAAAHSRDITQQLLAFSRKQIIVPEKIDLNVQINYIKRTLLRLIGEDISLRFKPGNDLWKISFDASQIDQILINLAINSRDAMPGGGIVTITTGNIEVTEPSPHTKKGVEPGKYIRLLFSDNGDGMEKDVLDKIFEPFFTTKEVGKGTGLGLSTVYGIIKQNKGHIEVISKPGQGTDFEILLPAESTGECADDESCSTSSPSDKGLILLVEDNDQVRKLTSSMLEKMGYNVVVAESPRNALEVFRQNAESIDLLLTDVVMPEMSGTDLKECLDEIKPGIKALFMSGYTSERTVWNNNQDNLVNLIHKPFSRDELGFKLQEILDAK